MQPASASLISRSVPHCRETSLQMCMISRFSAVFVPCRPISFRHPIISLRSRLPLPSESNLAKTL